MKEQIFKDISPAITHLAWCCYMMGMGKKFNVEPKPYQIESLKDAADFFWKNPKVTPRGMHENWLKHKKETGWVYGKVKHSVKKTHPCIKRWDALPAKERNKDVQHIMAQKLAMTLATAIEYNIKAERAKCG